MKYLVWVFENVKHFTDLAKWFIVWYPLKQEQKMQTLTSTAHNRFLKVVERSFDQAHDGFWYPKLSGEALVRIAAMKNGYAIERRRKPDSVWLPITTASYSSFDEESFVKWMSRWPLTQ